MDIKADTLFEVSEGIDDFNECLKNHLLETLTIQRHPTDPEDFIIPRKTRYFGVHVTNASEAPLKGEIDLSFPGWDCIAKYELMSTAFIPTKNHTERVIIFSYLLILELTWVEEGYGQD